MSPRGTVHRLDHLRSRPRVYGENRPQSEAQTDNRSRIYLLERIRVLSPEDQDILPARRRTQAVFTYLCFARGQRVNRLHLAQIVWDTSSSESQARDNLRHSLRELDHAGGSWRLLRDRDYVQLDTADCWIDAFETPARGDALLREFPRIGQTFDNWLADERDQFELRWQMVLEARLAGAEGALRMAAARELLNIIPSHDDACCALIAAFDEDRKPAEAVREFDRYKEACGRVGTPPSSRAAGLIEAIRAQLHLGPPPSGAGHPAPRGDSSPPALPNAGQSAAQANSGAAAGAAEPTIAVLPFRLSASGKTASFLSEGLADDLTETLARMPGVRVTSRYSAAAAIRKPDRTLQQIGEALGVRYIVSGSLRTSLARFRVVVEMTDTGGADGLGTSHTSFEDVLSGGDLLDVQSRLATKVARWIAAHLRSSEIRKITVNRQADRSAYALLLRGEELMNSLSKSDFMAARRCFEQALEAESGSARTHAWLAHWHVMNVGQGWSDDPANDARRAEECAKQATACNPAEALALAVRGHVASYFRKEFDVALSCFDAALRANPNAPRAWLWSSYTRAWIDEGSAAVEHIDRAMALSPYDPLLHIYTGGAALAYKAAGQYARSIEFALRCIREQPGYTSAHKSLVLARMLLGQKDEGRAAANRLRMLEPTFTVDGFRRNSPAAYGRLGGLYCQAFADAGIPLTAPETPENLSGYGTG